MRKLVLWGHQLDEYCEMFDLSKDDCSLSILEYGSGPSAINAQLHDKASKIVSIDPLFSENKRDLIQKSSLFFDDMVANVERDLDKFNFKKYGGLDGLIEKRRQGMSKFFADYDEGKAQGRYLAASANKIELPDFSFDLALSSHYLFADIEGQDINFHVNIIKELARVAKEVRIFPLIDRFSQPSKFLGPVMLALQQENFGLEVREVKYHLQPQGNAMLRVWAQQCAVV